MAEDSADRWECEAKIAKRFGFEQQLELPIPLPVPAQQEAPIEAAYSSLLSFTALCPANSCHCVAIRR
jgi:hypothetical protein